MTDNDNQNQRPARTFNDLVGTAENQQKHAIIKDFEKKAAEWAKERREAQRVLDSIDEKRRQLEEDYAAEMVRFK